MKNWRTTIIGALLAGLSFLAIYQANGGDLGQWQQWIIPALIAVLGYLAKDAGVTGGVKALGLMLALGSMLLMTSCAGLAAFAASPFGQSALVTAEALGKQLAKATEQRVVEGIIIKATAQVAALKAVDDTNGDLGREIVRESEIIGLQSVIDTAQGRYVTLTGGRFVVPKNPVGKVNPGS